MTEDREPPRDLLLLAAAHFCRDVSRPHSLDDRLLALWAATAASADLGVSDVVEQQFIELAEDVGLDADLGRHGGESIRNVVRWALLGLDPFGN